MILSASYAERRSPVERYTFASRDGTILPLPGIRLGHKEDGIDSENRRINYQFEHVFSPSLRLISRMQYADDDTDVHVRSGALLYPEDGSNIPSGEAILFTSRNRMNERTLSGDHYLRYTVRTAGILHKLSVGVNHSDYKVRQLEYAGLPITAQVYPVVPTTFPDTRTASTDFSSDANFGQRQKALYLQDMATYGNWTALINLRRNEYTTGTYTVSFGPEMDFITPATRTFRTTPGAGVVYRMNEAVSLYANYSEGFVPQNLISCASGLTPPSITKNKEAGAKFDLMDSKLALTASMFSLQQSNYVQFNELNNCFDVRPAQKTNGVEFDVQGRLAKGLDIVLNYTYNRIEDVGDKTTIFAGFPKHKFNSWAVYNFQQPELEGLGVGLGLSSSSSSLGTYDPEFPFHVPGQAQVDASVFYGKGPWNVTFGVKNLADRRLYGTSSSASFVPVLPGREFMLTVKRSFN